MADEETGSQTICRILCEFVKETAEDLFKEGDITQEQRDKVLTDWNTDSLVDDLFEAVEDMAFEHLRESIEAYRSHM